MILIPATVKNDIFDILAQRTLRDARTNLLRSRNVSAMLQSGLYLLLGRRCCGNGLAVSVVDKLYINMAEALIDTQPGPCRSAGYTFADSFMSSLPGF